MKKKNGNAGLPLSKKIFKYLLVMKLLTIFILGFTFTASALPGFTQERISLNLKNSSLSEIFKKIESKTSYRFVYSEEIGKDKSSISVYAKDAELDNIMQQLIRQANISYEVTANNLVSIKYVSKPLTAIITGRVTDETGAPIAGASITEKGTNKGTVTNDAGIYQIEANYDAVLEITAVGYLPQTVSVNKRTVIDIVLQKKENKLDEVVIQAYGTTSKRKTTSAISNLDMKSVAPLPVQSINDAVAGRLAGIIVTTTNGAPGTKSSISIRGGSNPLYVIDNIIRSANDFANLNPNDIEDYSILKDAAATALYGVSGANGVILVTTKKGRAGRMDINYSFNQIFSQPTLFPTKLSSYDQLNAINRIYQNEGKTPPTSAGDLEKYRSQSDPLHFPNTAWQDITMKKFAPEIRHDLSLTSGSKTFNYYAGISYYDQGSILRTDKNYNKRTTYRLNATNTFERIHLKVFTGVDGFVEANMQPAAGYSGIYSHIQNRNSRELARNEFGLPTAIPDNPFRELDPLSGYNKNTSRVFNGNLTFDYSAHFLEGLKFRINGMYNMWNSVGKSWNYLAPGYAIGSTTPINANAPSLSSSTGEGNTTTLQGWILYSKKFGDHTIDFTGIYEQQKTNSSSLSGTRVGYQIIFDQFVAGPATDQTTAASEAKGLGRASYLGRITYNYKSKYSVEFSARRDGSYLFPPENRWGNFYAASANYVISEESFMAFLKKRHIFDFLKLRGSYGLLGDDSGVGQWLYVSAYGINSAAWIVDGKLVQGTSEPGSLPNNAFSWQEIKSSDLALEFGSFNNRLTGAFDYFYNRRTGFVVSDPRFAQTLGIGLPPINFTAGAVRKEGFDFSINWADKLATDFTYKIGVNYTRFNTVNEKTTESEAAMKNPYTRNSNSASDALLIGYYTNGFYTNNLDLLTGARKRVARVGAGDVKYVDANGDGQINGDDTRRLGTNTFPRVNFGLTLDLGYKGAFLSAVLQGSGNRDRILGSILQGNPSTNVQMYAFQQDYWRPDNTNALFPRAVSSPTENGGNNFGNNEAWLISSKYLRLKYLQVGYDFKFKILKNSAFQQLKVFASGSNLLTSSKSMKYFIDPESDMSNYGYPVQRTFALGINVGF